MDTPCNQFTTRHGQDLFQASLATLLLRATNNRQAFPFNTNFNDRQSLAKRIAESLVPLTLMANQANHAQLFKTFQQSERDRKKHVFGLLQQLYAEAHVIDVRKIKFVALRQKNRALNNASLLINTI